MHRVIVFISLYLENGKSASTTSAILRSIPRQGNRIAAVLWPDTKEPKVAIVARMNGAVRALGGRKTIKNGSREVFGHDYGLQRVIAYSHRGDMHLKQFRRARSEASVIRHAGRVLAVFVLQLHALH